jgi:hypothetical protein
VPERSRKRRLSITASVRQFTSLPCFDLLSYRLEVSLHAIDTNGDAVDKRERLRLFSKNLRKTLNNSQLALFQKMVDLIGIAPKTASKQRKQSQRFEARLHQTGKRESASS